MMQFLDFEDDRGNPPDPSTDVGRYRLKCAEIAQKHKDNVLDLLGGLSIKPQHYVIGYEYIDKDGFTARDLRFCAFDARPVYEYRMRQIFYQSWAEALYGSSNPTIYGLDSQMFPSGLRELPSIPAIYFCCQGLSEEPFELWYIGKTNNLNSRWKNHHKFNALKAVGVNQILYQDVTGLSDSEISILERLYITMYFPRFNDRQTNGFSFNETSQSLYRQGFSDGYEKATQDAIDYFSKEINALHSRIFRLQGEING